MKIILVYPNVVDASKKYHINTLSKYPTMAPLGIMYLAAILEQEKHQVKIYDNALYEYTNKQLIDLILKDKPNVVCFSTTFKNIKNARACAKRIKTEQNSIRIIFGGPQASYFPEDEIKHEFIDAILVGEAENVLPGLLKNDLSDLSGIIGPAPLLDDLDSLPYPAWHLWDIAAYKKKWPNVPVFTMITSRGCPYRCTFCSLPAHCRKYRTRDPIKVVDELEFLVSEYGARTVAFMEDNFALDRVRAANICDEIIKRKLKVKWRCDTRVNNVTEELLAKMKAAGLWIIFFGLESGSQKTLDFLKKDITLEQVRRTFTWCQKLGIETFASFMMGIPGETKEDIFNTFDFMCSIKPAQTSFQTYVAIPGSELYEHVKKNKLYSDVWETALIVSTKELPRKEVVKIEQEITFRIKLYNLFRKFQLDLIPGDHQLHSQKSAFNNVIPDLTQAVASVKLDPSKGLHALQKIVKKFAKLALKDKMAERILIYCYLLSGLIHSIKGNKKEAIIEAKNALALDKKIKVPFSS